MIKLLRNMENGNMLFLFYPIVIFLYSNKKFLKQVNHDKYV